MLELTPGRERIAQLEAENARLTAELYKALDVNTGLVQARLLDSAERDALATQLAVKQSLIKDQWDTLDSYATRCRELEAFANDVLEHQAGSLDGCEIQEYGVKHGLLVKFTATEPCGEDCACAEVGLPTECYRRAALAASETSTPPAPICWRCQEVECECEPSTPK